MGGTGLDAIVVSDCQYQELRNDEDTACANPVQMRHLDPDLLAVIEAWPRLNAADRRMLLRLVKQALAGVKEGAR